MGGDSLSGAERRSLRARGRRMNAAVVVGKAGATDAVAAQVDRALRNADLIKVRLPADRPPARKATAEDLAGRAGAVCVDLVGRSALLYRRGEASPAVRGADEAPKEK